MKVEVVGICAGDGKVMDGAERFWGKPGMYLVSTYRESHLRNSFFKGLKMSDNQYVDKKKDSSIITKPHHLTYNL